MEYTATSCFRALTSTAAANGEAFVAPLGLLRAKVESLNLVTLVGFMLFSWSKLPCEQVRR
jgi:hypothetical protein